MKIIAQQSESTVVTEYKSDSKRQTNYQSERELELALINQLKNQGYTFLEIHVNDDLVANLKVQLERLNKFQFTDKEWKRFLIEYLEPTWVGLLYSTTPYHFVPLRIK
jgi:type I restriction enzyme R subunit